MEWKSGNVQNIPYFRGSNWPDLMTISHMADDRDNLIRAMEDEYDFPGYYPITLIARNDDTFSSNLQAALEYEQDGAGFEITERPSRKNNYISYRITVYVDSAEEALQRKDFLRELAGVLVML